MIRRLRFVLLSYAFLLAGSQMAYAQTADFSFSPASGCAPLVVNFTDLSTGAITSYSWNLGNSVTSSLQNPSTTYTAPGSYPITLTVTGPAGSDTKTGTVVVYDKPAASFVAAGATAGCTPLNVQYSSTVVANSPGSVNYSWDFGDGTTGTGANPAHTYVTPGTYSVLLTVTNGAGCVQTVVQNAYITARPVPRASFTASQNYFCNPPASVTFANTTFGGSAPYTANWDFGDGGTGSGSSIAHTYTIGGNFTVRLFVSDKNGCVDTLVNSNLITVVGAQPSFTSSATVCEEAYATFQNTTPGAFWASWDFGDGRTDPNANAPVHQYMSAGTYTVKMTTVVGGCTKSTTKTIQIDPKPRATYSMNPPIPCPTPVTVSFSAYTTVPTVAYDWRWNSGGTASGSTVSKFYPTHRRRDFTQDTLTLITTSAAGCKDTLTVDSIYIRNILVSAFPGGDICDTSGVWDCFPQTAGFYTELKSDLAPPPIGSLCPQKYFYPYTPSSWLWDFDDGSPKSTLAAPVHTFTTAGTYRVKVVITTPNGCIDSTYSNIHLDSAVHPTFTISPSAVCTNSPVIYTNTTADHLPGTKYDWGSKDIRQNITDTSFHVIDPTHAMSRPRQSGKYTIFLFADHFGCKSDTTMGDTLIVHPPYAQFKDSTFCSPNNAMVKFINQTDSATSFYWDFGDGTTSTATNPTHTYAALGLYNVSLVAHNSIYGCSDTTTKPVRLFKPIYDFVAADSTICVNGYTWFESRFSGFGTPQYSFFTDRDPTSGDTAVAGLVRYSKRGYHDVMMVAKGENGCYDTVFKPGYVLVSQPGVKYSVNPEIGCNPLSVAFRDSSDNVPGVKNVTWEWTYGDGYWDTTKTPSSSYLYTIVKDYRVHLVVTDTNGCKSEELFGFDTVSVRKPVARYTVSDTTVCGSDVVKFLDPTALAKTLKHLWTFGDGSTDTGVAPTHRYKTRGTFGTQLIVTDSVGCKDTLAADSVHVEVPTAAYTQSDTLAICPPLLVRFNNLSTYASTYLWNFGAGGSPIVVTNPVSTFSTPGVYDITLVAIDASGCSDTARSKVRVLGYNGAFTYTPVTGCAPMEVTFTTPLNGISQITWDYGDGSTNTTSLTTTTHTYQNAGPYMPKVIFSDGASCVSTSIGLDTIHVDQMTADFSWSVPCVGTAFTLKDSSTARYKAPDSWSWYFGAADTAAGTPVTRTYTTSGNHTVILVAMNATGCKDTVSKTVFVNELPKIDVTSDTAICPGDPVKLMATGGLNYTWMPTPDSMKNCPVCDVAFVHLSDPTPGAFDYFVVRGTDVNGCINSDSTKVTIQLKTTSTTGAGGEICVGESFRLHASGAQKYEWIPKETIDSPFIASPLATPQRTTTYIVAAQEGTCLVDSQRVQVIVHSAPVFSAGHDEVIALGGAVTLKPTKSGISRIEWVPDTTLSCTNCFDPTAHPYFTRTYYVTAYNEFGCSATDSVTVFVRCNGNLVFIPNTFTPNGDGKNDYFYPRGEGIEKINEFRIFNRWGEMVFERSNISLNDERSGWDGRFMGKELPPDVYVYYMQANCSTGELVKWKGDVTLMR
jgi:gliding motility-associated-like protein